MRTTVTLAADAAAAVERLRRERQVGVSEAINELIRDGLAQPARRQPFTQRTEPLGLRVDVTNVAEALETLDRMDVGDGPSDARAARPPG